MSVLTFLLTTKQVNILTFDGDFDFHMKITGGKRTWDDLLDKPKKKDLIENKLKGNKDQTFTSGEDSDSLTWLE